MKCAKCHGCGQVADTDDQEPWTAWTALPLQSAGAVVAGLVKPIDCPVCGGTGEPAKSAATERLWADMEDFVEDRELIEAHRTPEDAARAGVRNSIEYCRADKVVDKDVEETMAKALKEIEDCSGPKAVQEALIVGTLSRNLIRVHTLARAALAECEGMCGL